MIRMTVPPHWINKAVLGITVIKGRIAKQFHFLWSGWYTYILSGNQNAESSGITIYRHIISHDYIFAKLSCANTTP